MPEKTTTFAADCLTVIGGKICIPLPSETGHKLAKAFSHAGTWYIAERDARLTRLTPAGGCVYRATLGTPA